MTIAQLLDEPGGHAECSVSLWPLLPPPAAQPTFAYLVEVAGAMSCASPKTPRGLTFHQHLLQKILADSLTFSWKGGEVPQIFGVLTWPPTETDPWIES